MLPLALFIRQSAFEKINHDNTAAIRAKSLRLFIAVPELKIKRLLDCIAN